MSRDWKIGQEVVVYVKGYIKNINQSGSGIELTIRYPNPDRHNPFAFDKGCAIVSEDLVTRAKDEEERIG